MIRDHAAREFALAEKDHRATTRERSSSSGAMASIVEADATRILEDPADHIHVLGILGKLDKSEAS